MQDKYITIPKKKRENCNQNSTVDDGKVGFVTRGLFLSLCFGTKLKSEDKKKIREQNVIKNAK